MLSSDRLRNPALFDKIVTADKAADLIQDGMNVGFSGFTPSGYPNKTTLALAEQIKNGKKCRSVITIEYRYAKNGVDTGVSGKVCPGHIS